MKDKKQNTPIIIGLILGLSIMLYPMISNLWNNFSQAKAMGSYVEQIDYLDTTDYSKEWDKVKQYNDQLFDLSVQVDRPENLIEEYNQCLNYGDRSMMGIIEIPKLHVKLPIYHGTDEAVLQVAIGHVDWSSLPSNDQTIHTVLSGHRGLPSAQLFSNLDEMEIGDTFTIDALDRCLTYLVDDIRTVTPDKVESLHIEDGKNLCTLVTCTPYGINTHRLLIQGHLIDTVNNTESHIDSNIITNNTPNNSNNLNAAISTVGLIFIIVSCIHILKKRRKRNA